MPINNKSRINNIITWLHLWLGLISGIIVVIVSVTGCLFAFQVEITNLVHKKELFIAPPAAGTAALPMHTLMQKAAAALSPGHDPDYITTYRDPRRAWEFMDYQIGDQTAITFPGTIKSYQSVFLNPYTGAVTGKLDYKDNFFFVVKYIHWSLYLNTRYGQPIVGWGTLIFVVSLITGFIMWIPKRWNKLERGKSFKIRWKANWKRLNYDLHNVLGFYTVLIALVLGLTGLIYAFQWFSRAVYATATLSTAPAPEPSFVSDSTLAASPYAEDRAYLATREAYPRATRYGISWPAAPQAPLAVTAYRGKEVYYDATTEYYDRYSGKKLGKTSFADENAGEKIIAMNYDIHVGAIGGLVGKIIAFIVSLIAASLPITGFVIWWGKRKKAPAVSPGSGPRSRNKARVVA